MNEKMRICISSPPDREHLVAEVFFGDEQWAELNRERGELRLELYARRDSRPWSFGFDDAMEALSEARKRLELKPTR